MKQLIKENEPPFRNRKFRVSPGNHYFVRVCTFPAVLRFFGNFRFFLVRRELLDPSHRNPPPPPFPNRRMRRESLAQVTLLLKTMKQTLYERGYGANYLAISRPSNKWASPPTSLSLSFSFSLSPFHPPFLRLLFGPPSRSRLSFHRQTFVTLLERSVFDSMCLVKVQI